MSSVNLNSEGFERAAYNLTGAMNDFPGLNFGGYVDQFQRSVDQFGRLLALQAENDNQKYDGLPHGPDSFLNA